MLVSHGIRTHYILLDTNVVAGYYLPESLDYKRAKKRITNIVESVRNGGAPEIMLYIPNICIPELMSVFVKYRFATWNRHVRRNLPTGLKKARYEEILNKFRTDIHNGKILQQVELNRYHIMATDLISVIDANFEFYRNRSRRNKQTRMMGATDHSIIGMGIELAKIHGHKNFTLITADHRLADILNKAKNVAPDTATKLGLNQTAQKLGFKNRNEAYPNVINLANAKEQELRDFFGKWPLPLEPLSLKVMKHFTNTDGETLSKIRKKLGETRDRLPYTDTFEQVCGEFEREKGVVVDRHEAWLALTRFEKKPKKKITK